MKVAPVMAALKQSLCVRQMLIHTGQHYDADMSSIFLQELGLPKPDFNLNVGSASHTVQTAEIMIRLEPIVVKHRPDWVLVYGDVNSTLAAALVCAKLQIPFAHVEAGLRSFDRAMPEEVNRQVTDGLADLLFTPSEDGNINLRREGVAEDKIHLVGNVMIDTLVQLLPLARERWPSLRNRLGLGRYGLVTLHRPSNVDEPTKLHSLLITLDGISQQQLPLVFPVHPRTRGRIAQSELSRLTSHLILIEPLGYIDFLGLQDQAVVVITDSGGVQEETTFLGVPCLTLRENTERPITVTMGTNKIVGKDMTKLQAELERTLIDSDISGAVPPLWDVKTGTRIAQILLQRSG